MLGCVFIKVVLHLLKPLIVRHWRGTMEVCFVLTLLWDKAGKGQMFFSCSKCHCGTDERKSTSAGASFYR